MAIGRLQFRRSENGQPFSSREYRGTHKAPRNHSVVNLKIYDMTTLQIAVERFPRNVHRFTVKKQRSINELSRNFDPRGSKRALKKRFAGDSKKPGKVALAGSVILA
jgi:hypothetical protein